MPTITGPAGLSLATRKGPPLCQKAGTTSGSSGATQIVMRQTQGTVKDRRSRRFGGLRKPNRKALLAPRRTSTASGLRTIAAVQIFRGMPAQWSPGPAGPRFPVHQWTPPWCEHVPLRVCEKLQVPSAQTALAPAAVASG